MQQSNSKSPTKLYWLHALTPLHVGTGVGVGFIDLPIQREKATGWPIVPGSAVKGVLADHFGASPEARKKNDETGRHLRAAFGIADSEQEAGSNSGSLVFTDARLVCLPVRSLYGTFAWVSCPLALSRLSRDAEVTKTSLGPALTVADGSAAIPAEVGSALIARRAPAAQRAPAQKSAQGAQSDELLFLGDLDLKITRSQEAQEWAKKLAAMVFPGQQDWQTIFQQRFVVVSDDTFNFFCETATEVTARVRLDDQRKTVQRGALWYEEYLPAEAVLCGLVWCDRVYGDAGISGQNLLEEYCAKPLTLQIGGKATVGRGRVRCLFGGNHA